MCLNQRHTYFHALKAEFLSTFYVYLPENLIQLVTSGFSSFVPLTSSQLGCLMILS